VPIPSSNARDSFYHQSFLTPSPQMLDENERSHYCQPGYERGRSCANNTIEGRGND